MPQGKSSLAVEQNNKRISSENLPKYIFGGLPNKTQNKDVPRSLKGFPLSKLKIPVFSGLKIQKTSFSRPTCDDPEN